MSLVPATHVSYVAAADQREFDVSFPYLHADHVEVVVGGIVQPLSGYEWVSPTRIRLKVPPVAGTAVTLRRRTPIDQAIVTFRNGSVLTEEELNKSVLQVLYVQQELLDLYTNSLDRAKVRLGDNLGVIVDPDAIMDQLVQMVLADELLAELRTRIDDINGVATALIEEQLRTHNLKQGVNVIRDEVRVVKDAQGETASVLDLLVVKAPDGNSLTLREDKVYRGNGESLAQTFSAVQTNIDAVQASVTELESATVGPEGAVTKLQTSLGAFDEVGGGFILNDLLVKRSNGESLAESFNGITARLGDAEAAVVENQEAIADEASARATAISGLQAQVNGFSSSITILQQVDAQLGARWGVALDANGNVSGVVMNNGGQGKSSFDVVADRFAIINPGAPNQRIVPFSVVDGYANFAQPISVYKVGATHKAVLGPGFGASGNCVLWFGPSWVAVAAATIDNSIFCLTTDGQIKFPTSGGGGIPPIVLSVPFNQTSTTSRSVTVTPMNGSAPYNWRWTFNGLDSNAAQWGISVVSTSGVASDTFTVTINQRPPPGEFVNAYLTVFCEDSSGAYLPSTRSVTIRFNG
ncbi:phage tail fiber protein [Phenylobacterium sp.]|uniref:phage tail fiber domain-containing protein n=1 Tax=Phenylobacterium sp. TaxID=1871053 RepID=UPI00393600BE